MTRLLPFFCLLSRSVRMCVYPLLTCVRDRCSLSRWVWILSPLAFLQADRVATPLYPYIYMSTWFASALDSPVFRNDWGYRFAHGLHFVRSQFTCVLRTILSSRFCPRLIGQIDFDSRSIHRLLRAYSRTIHLFVDSAFLPLPSVEIGLDV